LWIFWKVWNFGRNMYQMMELKMHGFWAILSVCLVMVPSGQQPPEVGINFLAVGELKEASRVPIQEHVTPFKTASHLPVAHGGHSCSPQGVLRAHTSNRSKVGEEKSYWRWKIAERCKLRRRTATVRLLCDAFLAYLSWKLKWAFLIAFCPSSVCLSVRLYVWCLTSVC
jgi:hypothetical protein